MLPCVQVNGKLKLRRNQKEKSSRKSPSLGGTLPACQATVRLHMDSFQWTENCLLLFCWLKDRRRSNQSEHQDDGLSLIFSFLLSNYSNIVWFWRFSTAVFNFVFEMMLDESRDWGGRQGQKKRETERERSATTQRRNFWTLTKAACCAVGCISPVCG